MNEAPATRGSVGRVLIVDDSPEHRQLMRRRLEDLGLSAELRPDTQSGWHAGVSGGFDAFVIDLLFSRVPEGVSLIRSLKADPRTAAVPVVAVTAFDEGHLKDATRVGADLAIDKHEFSDLALPFIAKRCLPQATTAAGEVLLVEDDDALLDVYTFALERGGFTVRTAASVTAAWQQLAERAPDVLLLDYRLPDGEGFELCRRVRSTPHLAQTYVVIVTGDRSVSEEAGWLDAGADTCWAKPIQALRLGALLKGALRSRNRPATDVLLGAETRLDTARCCIVSRGWESKRLNYNEIRFLETFRNSPEVTRAVAAEAAMVGGEGYEGRSLALNAFLRRFRKKLPEGLEGVITIPGKGFRLGFP